MSSLLGRAKVLLEKAGIVDQDSVVSIKNMVDHGQNVGTIVIVIDNKRTIIICSHMSGYTRIYTYINNNFSKVKTLRDLVKDLHISRDTCIGILADLPDVKISDYIEGA